MFRGLVALFVRSRSLRSGAVAMSLSAVFLLQLLGIVNGLRPDASVQADQLLGRAQYLITLPASAPIGATSRGEATSLVESVRAAGGSRVASEFLLTRVQPDSSVGKYFQMRESTSLPLTSPGVHLISGRLPSAPGEAAISSAGERVLGGPKATRFFGGALEVHVVGTYVDDLARSQPAFILGAGTWTSITVPDAARRTLLSAAATQNLYSVGGDVKAALNGVEDRAQSDPQLKRSLTVNPPQVQTRAQLMSLHLSPILQLTLAVFVVPLLVGSLTGAMGGRFIGRSRQVMWTLGIGIGRTRTAALIAVSVVSILSSIMGCVLGLALLPVTLRILDPFADHRLSGQSGLLSDCATFVALATASSVIGLVVAAPSGRDVDAASARKTANYRLIGLLLFVGAVVGGIFAVQGKTDATSISIAATAFGAALLVVAVFVVGLLLRLTPRRLVLAVAFRRAAADKSLTLVSVYLIGLLTVLGIGLATVLTSTYAAVNAGNAAAVPPGQIIVAPELASERANTAVALNVQEALQLAPPVIVRTADQGPDAGDGALAIVSTPREASEFTGAKLSASATKVLLSGGVLTSKPEPGRVTRISASESFRGAQFPSRFLTGANVGFRHWHGVLLADAAISSGLHAISPHFVFVHTTRVQRSAVPEVIARFGINPSWVQTYRGPDLFLPPSSYVLVSGAIVLLAGLISYCLAIADARGLTSSALTLMDLGLGRRFISGMLLAKTTLLSVAATTAGLVAAVSGSALAFSFSQLSFPLVLPIRELALQVLLTLVVAFGGALLGARRIINAHGAKGEALVYQ